MKIALVDVDSHNFPNLALMKISAWHKKQGDEVKVFDPLWDRPDTIYASKVFDFTPDYEYYPDNVELIFGGSGYGLDTYLPEEIENTCPDYSLYPQHGYALGFTTRGCIRNCPFCIVPQKEGKIKAVADIYDFWRGQEIICLLDNNLMALPPHFDLVHKQIIKEGLILAEHGMDVRLVAPDMAKLLSKIKPKSQFHFAWDRMRDEEAVKGGIRILVDNGVPEYRLIFYVLIGFDTTPEEDLYRVEFLRSLKVDPFVMPYDKHDPYQRRFARWVNHKAIFKSVKWEEYVA